MKQKNHILQHHLHQGLRVRFRQDKESHTGSVISWYWSKRKTEIVVDVMRDDGILSHVPLYGIFVSPETYRALLASEPPPPVVPQKPEISPDDVEKMDRQITAWIEQGERFLKISPKKGRWTLGVSKEVSEAWTQQFGTSSLSAAVTRWRRSHEHHRTVGPKDVYFLGELTEAEIKLLDRLDELAAERFGAAEAYLETALIEQRRERTAMQPRFPHDSLQRGQFWNRNPEYDPMDDEDDDDPTNR